jgi:hypothetical protein
MTKSRQDTVGYDVTDTKNPEHFGLDAGQGLIAQKKEGSNVYPLTAQELPGIEDAKERPKFSASEPKKNACGGSFATSPSCSDDPKNKNLIQKIICQGRANPVDSITFALLTAATVPAVVLQTAKWVNCGKPSKGALYAFGALGWWGVEVVRSINNIYVDEKKLV